MTANQEIQIIKYSEYEKNRFINLYRLQEKWAKYSPGLEAAQLLENQHMHLDGLKKYSKIDVSENLDIEELNYAIVEVFKDEDNRFRAIEASISNVETPHGTITPKLLLYPLNKKSDTTTIHEELFVAMEHIYSTHIFKRAYVLVPFSATIDFPKQIKSKSFAVVASEGY